MEEDAERCRLRLPGVGGARKFGEGGGWFMGYCLPWVVKVGEGGVSVRVMLGRVRERRGMVGRGRRVLRWGSGGARVREDSACARASSAEWEAMVEVWRVGVQEGMV